jgi:phage tail-like protein
MARPRFTDPFQSFSFWAFDASLPTPLPVFSPAAGFSEMSMPEMELELKAIQPGNWYFPRQVIKKASVGPITLSKGARFNNADFWNWTTAALQGKEPLRRNIVLLQFMGTTLFKPGVELGLVEMVRRVPGRAFGLYHCLPTKYVAGSKFDARSSDVSIQELTFQPEYWTEMSMATLANGAGVAGAIGGAVAGTGLNVVSAFL